MMLYNQDGYLILVWYSVKGDFIVVCICLLIFFMLEFEGRFFILFFRRFVVFDYSYYFLLFIYFLGLVQGTYFLLVFGGNQVISGI